jgi:hypothetical protein
MELWDETDEHLQSYLAQAFLLIQITRAYLPSNVCSITILNCVHR